MEILRDLVGLGCDVVAVDLAEEGRRRAKDAGAAAEIGTLADLRSLAGLPAKPSTRIAAGIRPGLTSAH